MSGAGGGCDDSNSDDGSGGAGGDLIAQGWFNDGVLISTLLANSTFGFSFGQGEAARFGQANNSDAIRMSNNRDIGGAGGGWFGGFSGQYGTAGAGGGSSFALTKGAIIPKGNISAYNEFYNFIDSKPYAFDLNSEYLFDEVIHMSGIWEGNGRLIITIINNGILLSCICRQSFNLNLYLFLVIFSAV